MRTAATLLVTAGLSCGPLSTALAWGDLAHEVICEIASEELSEGARAQVQALIARDEEFEGFARSCIWPDHPRRRASEHFVNLPRDAAAITADPCPLADTCLVTAIPSEVAVLRSGAAEAKKLEALKFLGHWVGDLHQPLHVSFADDRGGNSIDESGPCRGSLHGVWDTCIVARKLGTDPGAIARALRAEITDADRTAWRGSGPVDWANESFRIATSAEVGYCVPKDEACWYDGDNEQLDDGEDQKTVVVDDAYLDEHLPTVRDRIKRAGVRLAALLEGTLGGGSTPPAVDGAAVSIVALLPNPAGEDPGRERVTLFNAGSQAVGLSGWKLLDRAGNELPLGGRIEPESELEVPLGPDAMPLNNGGDEVRLVAPGERVVSTVRYEGAAPGEVVRFP